MVVEHCYRQFGCETIHPTQKFYFNEFVANALCDNMDMIILTSNVVDAVRGQRHHWLADTLTQCSVHPSVPVLLTKDSPRKPGLYEGDRNHDQKYVLLSGES